MKKKVSSLVSSRSYQEGFSDLGFLIPPFFFVTIALHYTLGVGVDLLVVSFIGWFLCALRGIQGYAYSLLLLASIACFAHMFFVHDHWLRLGMEISYGLSLFMAACGAEERAAIGKRGHLQYQAALDAQENSLQELQDVWKVIEQERIDFAEKLSQLQKELEDATGEKASFEMLNDVIRKTNAKYQKQHQELEEKLFQLQLRYQQVLEDKLDLQQQVHRLSQEPLAKENRVLFGELNKIRCDLEQMHKINEQLVRLHALAHQKVEALESEQGKVSSHELTELVQKLARIEGAYKQLREQFEEKKELLHGVRQQLFLRETQVQTLEKDLEEKELNSVQISTELFGDWEALEEERDLLFEENQKLFEWIALTKNKTAPNEPYKEILEKALSQQKHIVV